MPDRVAPRLWLDVEDLFEYARANARPSGIQRVAFELYRTLQEQYGASGLVGFVRHDPARNSFRSVGWPDVAALFAGLTAREQAPSASMAPIRPQPAIFRFARRLVHRLPSALRIPVIEAMRAQNKALRAWARLLVALAGGVARALSALVRRDQASAYGRNYFAQLAAPGDLLLVLGSPWSHPGYAALIRAQRARGLRFGLLVYDLIPLRRPEWCDRGLVRLFRAWFESVLPLCDSIFAISRATAADVTAYAQERGIAVPAVAPLPMGSGFGTSPATLRTRRLPPPGSYALFVSTIEARKNHLLLFRVWQRLLEDLPEAEIPALVFAGRVGWLVEDLMHQIANTDNLDGHLLLIENPTDGELAALYEGCLFTLFPSFHEGWGLPVTESLAFGKPCLIADRAALPEAGGSLARRFDPDNLHDAYAAIREVVENRAELVRWEARVRREFRPVPWSATVEALLAGVGHPFREGPEAAGQHDMKIARAASKVLEEHVTATRRPERRRRRSSFV